MLARSMARRTFGVQRLLVYNVDDIAREGIRLYRVVRSDNTEDPALENSFRSHYELGVELLHTQHFLPPVQGIAAAGRLAHPRNALRRFTLVRHHSASTASSRPALTEARRPKQAPPDRPVDYGPRPCLIDV
jgi:hypothetical protein